MGYRTNYTLSVKNDDNPKVADFDKWLETKPQFESGYNVTDFFEGEAEACKWYGHTEDMIKMSLQFPDLIFQLKGEGEEPEDIWIKYYKNGKVQICHAKITFDEYDETKLEKHEN
jgi:hypothetical protein